MTKLHVLKSEPKQFDPMWRGAKTHDLRRADDRDFQVGDAVVLNELAADNREAPPTGRRIRATITYITSTANHCALSPEALGKDFAILSLYVTSKEESGADYNV